MLSTDDFLATATGIFRAELDDDGFALKMTDTQSDVPAWDSLAHVRIIMAMEAAYGIQFDAEEIENMISVKAIYDSILRHRG